MSVRTPRERGQSLTEILVIVALVAIGSIAFVGLFGDQQRNVLGRSSAALAGSNVAAERCTTGSTPEKNLGNFAMAGSGGNSTMSQTVHGCHPVGGPHP